jgi:hypothetical protein
MKRYCCHIHDREGQVRAGQTFEASHDNEAFGRVNDYLAQHPAIQAVEVWLEDRYVGKLHQPIVLGSLPLPSEIYMCSTATVAVAIGARPATGLAHELL